MKNNKLRLIQIVGIFYFIVCCFAAIYLIKIGEYEALMSAVTGMVVSVGAYVVGKR